jgi:hypothetical protein
MHCIVLTIHIAHQAYKIMSTVQSASFIMPWAWQVSQDVLTDAGFLCNEAVIQGDTTQETLHCVTCTIYCITYHLLLNVCGKIKICGGGLYVWELRYLLWKLWCVLPSGMMTDGFKGTYQPKDKARRFLWNVVTYLAKYMTSDLTNQ